MEENKIIPYFKIARPDHSIKQLFIIPGCMAAILLCQITIDIRLLWKIAFGLLSTTFVASANYVINEYLDAKFDKFHPLKKTRPLVNQKTDVRYIIFEYILLLLLGLLSAYGLSEFVFGLMILLAVMGILYNVEPIRLKDIPYLDVLSESFNMAIRFLIGWFLITQQYFPPVSIVLGYWFAGAYLMSVKRFSEYKMINDADRAGAYRKSFIYYSEDTLCVQSLFYAIISVFFLGIFLIKYRIELILDVPLLCILYCYYFHLSFAKDSSTQRPEKLFHEKFLMLYIVFFCVISAALLFIEIPILHIFLDNNLIGVR